MAGGVDAAKDPEIGKNGLLAPGAGINLKDNDGMVSSMIVKFFPLCQG